MVLHIAEEGMNEYEAGALLDAPEDRVAGRTCQAGPAVETGDDQDIEGRRPGQVLLDRARVLVQVAMARKRCCRLN